MASIATLFGTLLLAATPAPTAAPTAAPAPASEGPVIFFLMDNSASLPPLDPEAKRIEALEKMFGFLRGQRYRLILFGAKREISIDDVTRYRNDGQWTDFYYAFDRVRELAKEYPPGTEFRTILVTDAILDPDPQEWTDVPKGEDLKARSVERLLKLIEATQIPLYVILVGKPPEGGEVPPEGRTEQAPGLVLDMVRAANGARAAPMAQSMAAFFGDDGVLLKKFVYRVRPEEGLKKIEPTIRRITAPSRPVVEAGILGAFVLPLFLFLFLMLGLLVRSFPGPGDLEIVELALDQPVYVAADRLHRVQSGGWSTTGLSLVGTPREAAATILYQASTFDLSGHGYDTSGLDPSALRLMPLSVEDLRRALERLADDGTKEEKIFALNLDYMAKNMSGEEAERVLTAGPNERRRTPAVDFLRAKAHLITNENLRRKLIEARAFLSGSVREQKRELAPGTAVRIGRYGFIVKDIARGGRKDARLSLYYDRVPSLLGLKRILPGIFQRTFRFRRSSHRIVS
jgi:hypothetical protein